MDTHIKTIETTEGLYVNLSDLLKLLNKVYRTTCSLTVYKILETLRNGELDA